MDIIKNGFPCYPGDKVFPGRYICTTCAAETNCKETYVAKKGDKLPPCPVCKENAIWMFKDE